MNYNLNLIMNTTNSKIRNNNIINSPQLKNKTEKQSSAYIIIFLNYLDKSLICNIK